MWNLTQPRKRDGIPGSYFNTFDGHLKQVVPINIKLKVIRKYEGNNKSINFSILSNRNCCVWESGFLFVDVVHSINSRRVCDWFHLPHIPVLIFLP